MTTIYVARSAKFSTWASDVGLSKHVFKIGLTAGAAKTALPTDGADWAGETDWTIIGHREIEGAMNEASMIARAAQKAKMIDPGLYPRLRGATGYFKILPTQVENHLVVAKALANAPQLDNAKLKPADFAAYLIHAATR